MHKLTDIIKNWLRNDYAFGLFLRLKYLRAVGRNPHDRPSARDMHAITAYLAPNQNVLRELRRVCDSFATGSKARFVIKCERQVSLLAWEKF